MDEQVAVCSVCVCQLFVPEVKSVERLKASRAEKKEPEDPDSSECHP